MSVRSIQGGSHLGSATPGDVNLLSADTPTSYTASATVTAAELATEVLIFNTSATSASAVTMPSITDLNNRLINAKAGHYFDITVVNANTGTDITFTAGTGWSTNVGSSTIAYATSAQFRLRKTGSTGVAASDAWVATRI